MYNYDFTSPYMGSSIQQSIDLHASNNGVSAQSFYGNPYTGLGMGSSYSSFNNQLDYSAMYRSNNFGGNYFQNDFSSFGAGLYDTGYFSGYGNNITLNDHIYFGRGSYGYRKSGGMNWGLLAAAGAGLYLLTRKSGSDKPEAAVAGVQQQSTSAPVNITHNNTYFTFNQIGGGHFSVVYDNNTTGLSTQNIAASEGFQDTFINKSTATYTIPDAGEPVYVGSTALALMVELEKQDGDLAKDIKAAFPGSKDDGSGNWDKRLQIYANAVQAAVRGTGSDKVNAGKTQALSKDMTLSQADLETQLKIELYRLKNRTIAQGNQLSNVADDMFTRFRQEEKDLGLSEKSGFLAGITDKSVIENLVKLFVEDPGHGNTTTDADGKVQNDVDYTIQTLLDFALNQNIVKKAN